MSVPARTARPTPPSAPRGRGRSTRAGPGRGGPPLRLVTPPARRRPVTFVAFAFLLVALVVLGVASIHALLAESSFRVSALSRRVERLSEERRTLTLEVARLSAPRRVAAEARRLGLRLPEEVVILRVRRSPASHAAPGARDPSAVASDAPGKGRP